MLVNCFYCQVSYIMQHANVIQFHHLALHYKHPPTIIINCSMQCLNVLPRYFVTKKMAPYMYQAYSCHYIISNPMQPATARYRYSPDPIASFIWLYKPSNLSDVLRYHKQDLARYRQVSSFIVVLFSIHT